MRRKITSDVWIFRALENLFGKPDDKVMRMYKEIDSKIEKVHHILSNDDGDAEIVELCSQLAGEIEAKTSFALEIERLKQNREIERKTEESEKEAQSDAYATFLKLNDKKIQRHEWKQLTGKLCTKVVKPEVVSFRYSLINNSCSNI